MEKAPNSAGEENQTITASCGQNKKPAGCMALWNASFAAIMKSPYNGED
jgi:hypothetical protein